MLSIELSTLREALYTSITKLRIYNDIRRLA